MRIEQYAIIEVENLEKTLNYRFIAEQTHSSLFSTGKVKRKLAEEFTPDEIAMIEKISAKAGKWYLRALPKEEVKMTMDEFYLWKKLSKFCIKHCTMYGGK